MIISRHVVFDETQFPYAMKYKPIPDDYNFQPIIDACFIIPSEIPQPISQPNILTEQPRTPINPYVGHNYPYDSSRHVETTSESLLTTIVRDSNPFPPTIGIQSIPSIPCSDSSQSSPFTEPIAQRTRAKGGIFKPNPKYANVVSSSSLDISPIPRSYLTTLQDSNWYNAMQKEFDALITTHTWDLVPRTQNTNVICRCGCFLIRKTQMCLLHGIKLDWLLMVRARSWCRLW